MNVNTDGKHCLRWQTAFTMRVPSNICPLLQLSKQDCLPASICKNNTLNTHVARSDKKCKPHAACT